MVNFKKHLHGKSFHNTPVINVKHFTLNYMYTVDMYKYMFDQQYHCLENYNCIFGVNPNSVDQTVNNTVVSSILFP